ncbi:triphosphoribosyl-dephospho-CoA synthase MdcB [Herminiimonas sp. KBW02]|uniref:triphosphoribosyl-dephospho-CoA synthase MdcB n=1 Tax=Herminiimonas sp. KBW02 TaxID=2153363 RepID=UPI000F5B6A98|nr:triphosphoribosyl-dephospho-CoA synthase MdcB [Herminiimonas sp. KBW02]RQO33633.1 triphosphoribosyl-dephospho-CoA synthase MdcB [Herminiimonas sp. KBW02]
MKHAVLPRSGVCGSAALIDVSVSSSLRSLCLQTAIYAVRSLHAELVLYPKPGLVSPVDNGSHSDMDADLFMRSLFSLRHYFRHMAQAGSESATFDGLKDLGLRAERRMLAATGGINTHRGAIFSLGLLCAAAGYSHAHALPLTPDRLRQVIRQQWGAALFDHASPSVAKLSNGIRVAHLYAVSGARTEGAQAFPAVFEIGLPQLRLSLAQGRDASDAQVDALFALMAQMTDSNIYHRGGTVGAALVRLAAQDFIQLGGTGHPEWRVTALACHRLFVGRNLSPGGAADMLAASWLVHQLTHTVV